MQFSILPIEFLCYNDTVRCLMGGCSMKYMVYAALIFVAGLLFLPTQSGSGPRNLPLLITLIALYLLYYIIRFFKYIVLLSKTARLLKRQGYSIHHYRIFPFASFFRGEYSLLAEKGGEFYSFFFLIPNTKFPEKTL